MEMVEILSIVNLVSNNNEMKHILNWIYLDSHPQGKGNGGMHFSGWSYFIIIFS